MLSTILNFNKDFMKKSILLLITFFFVSTSYSQVLISMVFGDKLNSPFLEFGLEGGVNLSTISNQETTGSNIGFNLGFYFDIHLKKSLNWMVNTGVIVKSPMGAHGIPVYSLENETLDNTFTGGYVDREIRYFNVPILIKYKFDNNIYVKAGPQFGLLSKAFDRFRNKIDGDNVIYKNDIKDQVRVIDAGVALGLGYRITAGNGINVGMQYYYGLVPVMKGDGPNQYNRSLYLTAAFPIGKGKAAKRAAEKKALEEKNGIQFK